MAKLYKSFAAVSLIAITTSGGSQETLDKSPEIKKQKEHIEAKTERTATVLTKKLASIATKEDIVFNYGSTGMNTLHLTAKNNVIKDCRTEEYIVDVIFKDKKSSINELQVYKYDTEYNKGDDGICRADDYITAQTGRTITLKNNDGTWEVTSDNGKSEDEVTGDIYEANENLDDAAKSVEQVVELSNNN